MRMSGGIGVHREQLLRGRDGPAETNRHGVVDLVDVATDQGEHNDCDD